MQVETLHVDFVRYEAFHNVNERIACLKDKIRASSSLMLAKSKGHVTLGTLVCEQAAVGGPRAKK